MKIQENHLITYHISPLKMYYNSLRVINGEFSQHASMPRHLSSLKNNFENSRKIYLSKLVTQL
jgi:hypothetical protein